MSGHSHYFLGILANILLEVLKDATCRPGKIRTQKFSMQSHDTLPLYSPSPLDKSQSPVCTNLITLEYVILYKTMFPTTKKKGVLDCQKSTCKWQSRMFNSHSTSSFWQSEMPLYVNLELFLFIKKVVHDCR